VIKVAILGANGKMGSRAAAALGAAPDIEVVARIGAGDPLEPVGLADVAVDLTTPAAVMDNVGWAIAHRVHVVVGTSGLTDARRSRIETWLSAQPGVGALVAPNLSVGALLMMRMAAQAAPFFESVEIVETHHPEKADAPSGTAERTAQIVAGARRAAGRPQMPDATKSGDRHARGAEVEGVHVHSRRVRGVVAEQEVLLGSPGETLSIRHASADRTSFMPGLLAAVRWVPDNPGLTVGLEHVLGLA
jgi:4-hydroxy-tetrahydrodipicolinate reductase